MTYAPEKPAPVHYGIIVFYAFAVHGLLLLNDGIYWDGWFLNTILANKDMDSLRATFFDSGAPFHYCFHWLIGQLPDTLWAYRILSFASICLSAVFIYCLCLKLGWTGRVGSLVIALFSIGFSSNSTWVTTICSTYAFCYSLFFLAGFLALKTEEADGNGRSLGRWAAPILFLVSFNINSMLVFYFGFLLLFGLYLVEKESVGLEEFLKRTLPKKLDYVLLPFLYWAFKQGFTQTRELFEDYNKINFSKNVFVESYLAYFQNGILLPIQEALANVDKHSSIILVLLPALILSRYILKKERNDHPPWHETKSLFVVFVGLVFLFLGIFPYAAVGKYPLEQGWTTRHTLLIPLPMGILFFGIFSMLFRKTTRSFQTVGLSLLFFFLALFAVSNISTYMSWQMRSIKDQSVMQKLKNLPDEARHYSVYWIVDKEPYGDQVYYRFFEWSLMFQRVWEGKHRTGFDVNSPYGFERYFDTEKYLTRRFSSEEVDINGPQAALVILPGPYTENPIDTIARYFWLKYRKDGSLEKLLEQVTEIIVRSKYNRNFPK